ncbi:diacylglycerol O-acyltransferase 1 isoform X1 [Patella vulgata]|uniref:diacylglycerol O-acyltransferase 1 isoform X1 n=1 Tax=Patella vulgata TaxID=6465 RepID=UPI00217FA5B5|nr:diacylglycerol O-acyltransferase 1 isoform X1 [Patella vulgata]
MAAVGNGYTSSVNTGKSESLRQRKSRQNSKTKVGSEDNRTVASDSLNLSVGAVIIKESIVKESDTNNLVKTTVIQETVTEKGFFRRNLPEWIYAPEYMMQGKEKDPYSVHRHADSFFSTSSGFTNYRGLLNLCLILLVVSNSRLVLENIIKYGILANPIDWLHLFLKQPYSWPNVLLFLSINIFILFSLSLEHLYIKRYLSERLGAILQALNVATLLSLPATIIYILHPNPIFSSVLLSFVTVVSLKLISYACVNKWCRDNLKNDAKKDFRRRKTVSVSENGDQKTKVSNDEMNDFLVKYPDNINFKDLYYFIIAPTLVYELNFPRSARIRKRFLVKRIVEMLFLSQLIMALIQQWIIPTVNNAMKPLADMALYRVAERLLKLSIPNHFIWLLFFYWFFHSTLNVIAEVLRFGDRVFYRDWWNAETVSRFWQDWNVPVHRWALRHLYKPMMRAGFSKVNASIGVFFLSAFFHEYLLSIPLRMFKIWAFSAMIGQVPLALLTSKYKFLQGTWGNVIMWLSLIMGQPIAILAYVHDYYIINMGTLHNQTMTFA